MPWGRMPRGVHCWQYDVPSCLPLAFATGDGGNHANKSSIERMHGALKMQKIDVKLVFMKEIRILVVTESRGIRIEAANLLQPADDPVRNCGRELRANSVYTCERPRARRLGFEVRITDDVLDFARLPAGPARRQEAGGGRSRGSQGFRLPHFPSGYAGASRIKDAIGK
jgi:hypothetical protein